MSNLCSVIIGFERIKGGSFTLITEKHNVFHNLPLAVFSMQIVLILLAFISHL